MVEYPIGPLGLPLKSEEEQAIYYRQLEEDRYLEHYKLQMEQDYYESLMPQT